MSPHRLTALRVRAQLRRGSSAPVIVETEGGLFVAKLRGAGQGPSALVAECLVASIAELLDLSVPDRAMIEIADADIPRDDHNDELADLLARSVGPNLGFRWLDGASEPRASELAAFDDEFVARVLWLDAFVMNPDRTTENPNILIWKRQPWLIDHGADDDPTRVRARYHAFLWKRLKAPRSWLEHD